MVVDLQHEVHYLNNQLHPLLDEEEEDPEMLMKTMANSSCATCNEFVSDALT